MSFAMHPRWSLPALFGRRFDFVNITHRARTLEGGATSLYAYVDSQFDRSLTWRDVEWLAARWKGSLTIKGILTPQDADQAISSGADSVMISNHGGRQLDDAAAPIKQIASVAERIKGKAKIICDGGIRRGGDIVKALALGADACAIGRPYLYGLAAGGRDGVAQVLSILKDEFERTLILAGANDVTAIERSLVRQPTD